MSEVPQFDPQKKKILFFSRGRGRGHAIPDAQIADEILARRDDIDIQFISYSTGAKTLIELGYKPFDLELPERNPIYETLIMSAQLIGSMEPDLVVSHEEFSAITAARIFGAPTLFITDWFSEVWQPAMQMIKFSDEVVFIDESGVFEEPPELQGKVTYVGPLLPEFDYTRADRAKARGVLGIAEDATVVAMLIYPGRRSEEVAPIFDLLMPAFDALDAPNKLLLVNTSEDYDAMVERTADRSDVMILNEDPRGALLMAGADVAITKGNRNLVLELAALGIPSVTVTHGLNRIDDMRSVKLDNNITAKAAELDSETLAAHLADRLAAYDTVQPRFGLEDPDSGGIQATVRHILDALAKAGAAKAAGA